MNTGSGRKILSRGLVAEVEHCAECEIMHLHIGAFTLRLKPAVLNDLRDTLSRALAAFPQGSSSTDKLPHAPARPARGSCH